jgi:hypothetical protein
MKITKSQLKVLINEYLMSNNDIINEGITGTFLTNQVSRLSMNEKTSEVINKVVNLIDDGLGASQSVDEYLIKFAKTASDSGLNVAKVLTGLRNVASFWAILELYLIIPKQLVQTLNYLSAVEGSLRNVFEHYENLAQPGGKRRADRVVKYGLEKQDLNPDPVSIMGIAELTPDDMMNQLALELLDSWKGTLKVILKPFRSKGEQDAVVYQLYVDGIVSNNFKEEVTKRAQDYISKIKVSQKRLAEDIAGVAISQIVEGVKAGKQTNIIYDTVSPLWNAIAPMDVNLGRMFVESIVDIASN